MKTSELLMSIVQNIKDKTDLPVERIFDMIDKETAEKMLMDMVASLATKLAYSEQLIVSLTNQIEELSRAKQEPVRTLEDEIDFKVATLFREQLTLAIESHEPRVIRAVLGEKLIDIWATHSENGNEAAIRALLVPLGFDLTSIAHLIPHIRKVFFTEFPHIDEKEPKKPIKPVGHTVMTAEEKRKEYREKKEKRQ